MKHVENTEISPSRRDRPAARPWTAADDALLSEIAPRDGHAAAAARLGRSASACQMRASRLKLGVAQNKPPAKLWSPEEDAILRRVGAANGFPAVAAETGRSVAAVRQRAKQIGFRNGWTGRASPPATSAGGPNRDDPDQVDVGTPDEGWSEGRVAALTALVGMRLSASQVAGRMGVTRNAVIGRAGRLGLAFTAGPARTEARRAACEREREAARRRVEAAEAARRQAERRRAETAQSLEAIRSGDFLDACSIFELRARRCRFPLFEVPDLAAGRYCGAETRDAACPYCAGHAALAYRRPASEIAA